MPIDMNAIRTDALRKISSAKTPDELLHTEKALFGRKNGTITECLSAIRALSSEDKKSEGAKINSVKEELLAAFDKRRQEIEMERLDALLREDVLDLSIDLPPLAEKGSLHLIPEFIRQVEEVFGRMGFDVAEGPEIEEEKYNFDLLNIPKDHPARDMQDTFWINGGSRVLRTHTSPVQVRYAESHKPPFRMICPGAVYRKDADATHSPMFHQFEGLMVGKDVTLRHMKGVMVTAMQELVSRDITFRFRTGYFPFVEPGLEMDIQWMGDKKTKEGKWLEVVGCGMVHPQVLRNMGIDPAEWQGFAFGFGVERLLMIRHQIPDIRLFFEGDLRFLRQF